MTRDAALLTLLWEAGLRTAEQLQAAIVVARVGGLCAETLAARPGDFASYPVKLPPFHYEEDPR
jgi:hypothetical protein